MPDPLVPLVARIVEVLAAPASELHAELASAYVDQLLTQPLRQSVQLEELIELVVRTIDQANAARVVDKHVLPIYQRVAQGFAKAPERVGDLVSEDGKRALRAALAKPVRVKGRWLKGAVDPLQVQKLLGPIWVQLLVSFARRLPIPGLGGAAAASSPGASTPAPASKGGIAGMLGRGVQQSAGRLVGAGRSALEGLGIDIETKLMAAAKDFSESALDLWNKALEERLRSEDGKNAALQIKLGVLEHVLRTQLRDLHEDAVAIGQTPYFGIAPTILAHAIRVPFVRDNVANEIRQFVNSEGDRTLRELLAEQGMLEDVRGWLVQRVQESFGQFSQSPAFAAWLTRVIAAASQSTEA